jgi:hypothetical protein
MAGVRRSAAAVHKYLVALTGLAILVQIFLAGEGIFRIQGVDQLDDAKTLDAHRALGFILTEPIALLLLISAALAWYADKKLRWVAIGFPFLLFLQDPLAWIGKWVGGLHALNAFVLIALLAWQFNKLWRHKGETAVAQPA